MQARQFTVLVAEDHPGYRQRVVTLLEGWGLTTVVAHDGRQAIDRLRDHQSIDLLVTDMDMPFFTGFEVIEAWLRHGRRSEAVIMVTGEADSADVRDRCSAGGIRLIHKIAISAHFAGAVEDAVGWLERDRRGTAVEPE